jgi:hypothetical protein
MPANRYLFALHYRFPRVEDHVLLRAHLALGAVDLADEEGTVRAGPTYFCVGALEKPPIPGGLAMGLSHQIAQSGTVLVGGMGGEKLPEVDTALNVYLFFVSSMPWLRYDIADQIIAFREAVPFYEGDPSASQIKWCLDIRAVQYPSKRMPYLFTLAPIGEEGIARQLEIGLELVTEELLAKKEVGALDSAQMAAIDRDCTAAVVPTTICIPEVDPLSPVSGEVTDKPDQTG